MRRPFLLALASLSAAVSFASVAEAYEPFAPRAERLPTPGKNAASEDSADALVLHPANLANQPAWEVRWTGVRCSDTRKVGCGHSLEFATPLFFGLGSGLRADYILPQEGSTGPGFPYDGRQALWITWGLGYAFSPRFQIGGSVQWAYSTSPYLNGLVGLSLGLTYRPIPHLGFALGTHDVNGPSIAPLPTSLLPVLDRTYYGGLALRPFGTKQFEAGLELRYFDVSNDVRPRVTAAVDIPSFGRARADVEIARVGDDARRAYQGTVGLEVSLGRLTGGAGLLFGNGLGASDSLGQYGTVALSGYTSEPGIPSGEHGVSIRIEKTPGIRSHVSLLRALWKLAEDPTVSIVGLTVRSEPASSFAHAEELADALRVLRARGKKTFCSFEDAGAKALYVCANADRIAINPAGGVRYSGLKSSHLYLAKMLENLGIKAEFVRIGAHKSAPEQFMNEHASDVARADHEDALAQTEAVFVRNLALYRHISESDVRASTRKGPFIATEAKEAKFVDELAFDDELDTVAKNTLGHRVSMQKYAPRVVAPKSFGVRDHVAVLYIEGDIIDGRSTSVPLLGNQMVGSYTIAETAKQLRDDPRVRAVVLRIESPGGSSLASDVMWRELSLLAKKKPLIVSMGSIAASGGYYIAAAGTKVFALPLTITGSIGIFYGKADMSGLLKKIGVNVDVTQTTPRADAESLFRGFTEDERAELKRKVGQFYDVFLDRVAKGRKMSKESVDAVGQGRVWMGQQALSRGLVDEMGGLRHALEEARRMTGLPDDAPMAEYPARETSLVETALKLAGIQSSATTLPPALIAPLHNAAPLFWQAPEGFFARMEYNESTPVEDDSVVYDGF
jgi:protease IV